MKQALVLLLFPIVIGCGAGDAFEPAQSNIGDPLPSDSGADTVPGSGGHGGSAGAGGAAGSSDGGAGAANGGSGGGVAGAAGASDAAVEVDDTDAEPEAGPEPVVEACVPDSCEAHGYACGWMSDGCGKTLTCGLGWSIWTTQNQCWSSSPGKPNMFTCAMESANALAPYSDCVYAGSIPITAWCCPESAPPG